MNVEPVSSEPAAVVTEVPGPRYRVFLPQSVGERCAGFLWTVVRSLLFRCSPTPCHAWRRQLLRLFGATIGDHVRISPSTRVLFPWNLRLGNDVFIAHEVIINCMGEVRIGNGTRISQYTHIVAGTHAYERRDMEIVRAPITIGREVWLGADSFVGPGVTIGDQSLLAARSSAFRDLPEGQVCIGEPASPKRARFASGT